MSVIGLLEYLHAPYHDLDSLIRHMMQAAAEYEQQCCALGGLARKVVLYGDRKLCRARCSCTNSSSSCMLQQPH